MMEICGCNDHFELDEESNTKDLQYGSQAISPPKKSKLNISAISSYSCFYFKTVVITKNAEILKSGSNKDDTKAFTSFQLKIDDDNILCPISAVCLYNSTIYLASNTKNSNKNHLVIPQKKLNILDIGDSNPVSLFGGFSSAASIDSEGSVLFMSPLYISSLDSKLEKSRLPDGDHAISIACCVDFVFVVGLSGQLFESKIPSKGSKLTFRPVDSLKGETIKEVSGTYLHCFAVSVDGRVFGRGSNERGKLGIGSGIEKVNEFKELSSFGSQKVKHAYAGMNHSLFLAENGKVYACGDNRYGQLFTTKPEKNPVYQPIDTGIQGNVTFCVAGSDSSAVFIEHMPEKSPNRPIYIEKVSTKLKSKSENSLLKDSSSEISLLKEENDRLRKEKESLQSMIKDLQEKNKKLTSIASKNKSCFEHLSDQTEKTNIIEIIDSENIRNIEILDEIGYGSGGKVFLVTLKKKYALKQMNIQNTSFENLQRFIFEYEIMNSFNHPNILKTHGIFFSDAEIPPSILLEYCPMNLEQAIKKGVLTDVQIVFAIYQIAEGFKYIHFHKVIHRDLKPSNILISDDGTMKIADFGISKLITVEEQSMTKGLGTQKFMAPEMINEESYNEKVDVYAFGVLVYFIISGGELPNIKIKDICNGKTAEIPSSFPLLAKQMIEACWLFEPNKRPSFDTICQILVENNYNLLSFGKRKCQEVTRMIDQYKTTIPAF